jgi:hypothetical protein
VCTLVPVQLIRVGDDLLITYHTLPLLEVEEEQQQQQEHICKEHEFTISNNTCIRRGRSIITSTTASSARARRKIGQGAQGAARQVHGSQGKSSALL